MPQRSAFTKLTLTFSLVFLTMQVAFAQVKTGSVKGVIIDSVGKQKLSAATVNILSTKDSTIAAFDRSKEDGSFIINKLSFGKYLLTVSYTGFTEYEAEFSISASKPIFDFANIEMQSSSMLDNVVVRAKPVQVKGDTVEFNATSFKSNKPNAVVEDVLKKIPGVEIDEDGVIKVGGKEVKKILIDGKVFFANDPKLASKNLRADIINKIQVFEKRSDKSEFTGFDDGSGEPTINLTLKPDKRKGMFGKATVGVGNDGYYRSNGNINRFDKGEQLSFTGQANNINQQGFGAANGGGGFGGAGGRGLTSTQAAGVNYNNFKNTKLDFNSSYFFNHSRSNNSSSTRRETYLGDSTQVYSSPTNSVRDNYNHRLNLSADWKIDSANSIKIMPNISYNTNENNSQREYNTVGPKGTILSDGFTNSNSSNRGYDIGATILWRHKFGKKGRTLSAELRGGNRENTGEGSQYTVNTLLQNDGSYKIDTLDQRNNSVSGSKSYGISANYTEPLGKRSVVEFNAYHNHNADYNDKNTYDFNQANGAYDIENVKLTNHFKNSYFNSGTSVNYRENFGGWNYMIGARMQHSQLSSLLQGKTEAITQSFFNVLPTAQLQIGKGRFKNFKLNYNGNTGQPNVRQLQPVADITDPLNIVRGNPDLKQSFTNNVNLNYNIINPGNSRSFMINMGGWQTLNAIVNNDSVGAGGGKSTTFNNVNGVFGFWGDMNFGIPIKISDSKINLNFNTNGSYNRNINLQNDLQNVNQNINLSERVSVSAAYKEWLDVSIAGRVGWSNAQYSLNKNFGTNYFNYSSSFDCNMRLPKGFLVASNISYNASTGRAAGYNTQFTLWNASFGKSLFAQKQGEVRISVNDLLNQNTGIIRNSNGNSLEDTRFNVLKRYFMLSFTYNLNKFGMGGGNGDRWRRG
jgi:hypothetical protein